MPKRIIFNGEPGEVWTNDSGRAAYQFLANWENTCGLCAQYDHAIAYGWPIPLHRGCRCRVVPVMPGAQARPFVDFRAIIGNLDPVMQGKVVGKANLILIEKQIITWGDVVTSNRVRDLREVVSREKLTVDRLRKAGVPKSIAERAYETVHTPAHELAARTRAELTAKVEAAGVGQQDASRAVAERLAARVRVGAGPSGPGPLPVEPVTPRLPPGAALAGKPPRPEAVARKLRTLGVRPEAVARLASPARGVATAGDVARLRRSLRKLFDRDRNDRHSERVDGPTPAGGVALLALWRDAAGNPTTKDRAVAAEVHELDARGDSVRRTLVPL